jgi:hypothetical protein
MDARSKTCTVSFRFQHCERGSNLTRGMDVCLRFFYLCYPVWVEAMRCADPPSKESYQMSINNISKPGKLGGGGALDCNGLSCRTRRNFLSLYTSCSFPFSSLSLSPSVLFSSINYQATSHAESLPQNMFWVTCVRKCYCS